MTNKIYSVWGRVPLLYKLACLITFLGREEKLRRRAAEKLNLQKGDVVLDLACGTGLNFPYLQEYVGTEGKIIGFDYNKEMLSAAQNRVKENDWKKVELIQGDAAELSLEYRVDGVLSTLGISAIPRHGEALRRAVNVLKKGKRIVILDAKLFGKGLRILNPLVKLIYKYGADWDYKKDIPGDLERVEKVGKISFEEHNKGTIYILTGIKK